MFDKMKNASFMDVCKAMSHLEEKCSGKMPIPGVWETWEPDVFKHGIHNKRVNVSVYYDGTGDAIETGTFMSDDQPLPWVAIPAAVDHVLTDLILDNSHVQTLDDLLPTIILGGCQEDPNPTIYFWPREVWENEMVFGLKSHTRWLYGQSDSKARFHIGMIHKDRVELVEFTTLTVFDDFEHLVREMLKTYTPLVMQDYELRDDYLIYWMFDSDMEITDI